MDVWFDSGTSWTQAAEQADVYLEGSDQHRGWFQSSLLTYTSASGKEGAPFKTLITHGFTLDQEGKKMSKSIGNVIAPDQIIDGSLLPPVSIFESTHQYTANSSQVKIKKKGAGPISQSLGPDALRLWVASSDYTRDVVIGQSVLQANHSALLKYRMVIKMLLGSMHKPSEPLPRTKLDSIALFQLQSVMEEVATAYDNFEFYKAVNAINKWISTDLSAFYLEAMKDRLYCGDGGGALLPMFDGLLRMLAPITPNLVEEAWEHRPQWMKDEQQIHPLHRDLSDPDPFFKGSPRWKVKYDLPWILNANAAIKAAQEEARASKHIGSSLESHVVLQIPPGFVSWANFKVYKHELATIFVVSTVKLVQEFDAESFKGEWKYSATFDTRHGKATAWVLPATRKKCARCWRYVAPVEDGLCKRCKDVVKQL